MPAHSSHKLQPSRCRLFYAFGKSVWILREKENMLRNEIYMISLNF
jgi:hypothetical protein